MHTGLGKISNEKKESKTNEASRAEYIGVGGGGGGGKEEEEEDHHLRSYLSIHLIQFKDAKINQSIMSSSPLKKAKFENSKSSSLSSLSLSSSIPINQLLQSLILSLKDEWISECDELLKILQQPHLIALLNVVDCVARKIYDLNTIFDDSHGHQFAKILSDNHNNDYYNDDYEFTGKFKKFPLKKQRKLPYCQSKIIRVIKSQEPLGVTVRFDDKTGDIILARVIVGGAAYRSGVVNVGDKILECNGIPLRGHSHLDVIQILQRECLKTAVTFKILMNNKQRCYNNDDLEDWNGAMINANKPYIVKAHFDYDPETDPLIPCAKIGLSFMKGTILNILNKEDADWWQAIKELDGVGVCSNKSRMEIFQIAGLIPSKCLQERRIVAIRDIKSQLDRHRNIHILGGLIPLPFRKNKWCAQKIKKIMYDLEDCMRYDREEICTYEPVAKYFPNPRFSRPIILIGPEDVGCSILINLLCNHDPNRYREPLTHTSRYKRFQENDSIDCYFVSEEWMEKEIRAGNFICYSKLRGNYYGIHKNTVKQIVESGSICIFEMDARFLRLVHNSEFKPYVIFIRPTYDLDKLIESRTSGNNQFIYGQRQNRWHKSRQRLAYEMHLMIYESHKLQLLYGHKFDSIIINDNLQKSFEKLLEIINQVEQKPSWIPISWLNK